MLCKVSVNIKKTRKIDWRGGRRTDTCNSLAYEIKEILNSNFGRSMYGRFHADTLPRMFNLISSVEIRGYEYIIRSPHSEREAIPFFSFFLDFKEMSEAAGSLSPVLCFV